MSEVKYWKHLRPKFWQYDETCWLLADKVRKMGHVSHSGYRWLTDHAYNAELPGVITTNEATLIEWARMTPSEWVRLDNKVRTCDRILSCFVLYTDAEGNTTWHHEYVKKLYRDYNEALFEKTVAGYTKVCKRRYKKPDSDLIIHRYTDPYAGYTNKLTNEVSNSAQPAAAPEAAAAGRVNGDEGNPMKLGTFLRQSMAVKPEARQQ